MFDELKKYQDELLTELTAQSFSEAEKAEVIGLLTDRFEKVIVYTLLRVMSDQQKKEFEKLLENKEGREEVSVKLASEIPDLYILLSDALTHESEVIKRAMTK
jgi:hypothetical protein